MTQPSLFGEPGGGAAVAHIDGGARGNPGPAGYGVRIDRADGTIVELKESLGVATNNVAEYRGLLAALAWAAATASTGSACDPIHSCS
jgi:probable phosphoglycerate mutase